MEFKMQIFCFFLQKVILLGGKLEKQEPKSGWLSKCCANCKCRSPGTGTFNFIPGWNMGSTFLCARIADWTVWGDSTLFLISLGGKTWGFSWESASRPGSWI